MIGLGYDRLWLDVIWLRWAWVVEQNLTKTGTIDNLNEKMRI